MKHACPNCSCATAAPKPRRSSSPLSTRVPDCSHKTAHDHKQGFRWICSACGKVDAWRSGWGYYGNIECMRCGSQAIDWVACSEKCRKQLEAA